MRISEGIHDYYIRDRRSRVLARHLSELVPVGAHVLDVGCGDGRLARALWELRPDLSLRGVDVQPRADAEIPVDAFDGWRLPLRDADAEVVLLIDVVHHAEDPEGLLREAKRVCGRALVIKDHLCEGWLAEPTLRLMDRVGNERFGVPLPHHYWRERRWRQTISDLGLRVEQWRNRLHLYPPPLGWWFDRSLHFMARLSPCESD